jgi:hypothetical protein
MGIYLAKSHWESGDMNMTDMVERQELLKAIADLNARRGFVSEIIAEIAMYAEDAVDDFDMEFEPQRHALENIVELAKWAVDILDNGFEPEDEEITEPLGFEEEDLFKYKKVG